MSDENARSVQQSGSRFTVSASPFNPVKFELGIFVLVGIAVFAIKSKITQDESSQFLIMFAYSAIAALWLVRRTKKIFTQLEQQQASSNLKD
ncbi:MAG: hypothetical protein OEX00_04625 [Gammaproteobacteria bacterium]|nr:hypothetical protein [Gammaproteobacteria bacterium]MDH5694363.1 hypothetical protein [Gammaproteobacteria bacterium]